MNRCIECLLPDTKPDLWFDDEGICAACITYRNRTVVDWRAKKDQLIDLLEDSRSRTKSGWDCIVPVSGGKDSTVQVLNIKSLGFNPLCVTSTTCDLSELGKANLLNLKNLGVDLIEVSPNPIVRKRLNKIGLEIVGDISWPEHLGIFTIPARIAVAFQIPLLIWGENSQNEYGGPKESQDSQILDRRWLEEYGGLLGMRVSDLVETFGFTKQEIEPYYYPDPDDLDSLGIKGVFLGQFLPWDGYSNALIAQNYGFRTFDRVLQGSFVNYENLDNLQAGIHDYFKYLKFGFGRATDIASMHIRRGRISREVAEEIINERDGMYPSTYLGIPLDETINKIDLSLEDFNLICDKFTNRAIFQTDEAGELIRRKDGSPLLKNTTKK
jgi:N-acetyl sugar amidotransferase